MSLLLLFRSAGGTQHALAGTIAAVSTISAELTVVHTLQGTIVGQSAVNNSSLVVARPLEGAITGQSVINDGLTVSHTLVGLIAGQSALSGLVTTGSQHVLVGTITGQSTLTGDLTVARALESVISATSALANASLLVAHTLDAAVLGQSVVNGSLQRVFAVFGSIAGQSSINGDATVAGPPPAVIPATPTTGKWELLASARIAGVAKHFQPSSITVTKDFEKTRTSTLPLKVKAKKVTIP